MDSLRCADCRRTFYTPDAKTVLGAQLRCSHCDGELEHRVEEQLPPLERDQLDLEREQA